MRLKTEPEAIFEKRETVTQTETELKVVRELNFEEEDAHAMNNIGHFYYSHLN